MSAPSGAGRGYRLGRAPARPRRFVARFEPVPRVFIVAPPPPPRACSPLPHRLPVAAPLRAAPRGRFRPDILRRFSVRQLAPAPPAVTAPAPEADARRSSRRLLQAAHRGGSQADVAAPGRGRRDRARAQAEPPPPPSAPSRDDPASRDDDDLSRARSPSASATRSRARARVRCDLELLLREMRYFRRARAGVADPSSRRVEMAVHCDVAVFAWLLDWVRAKEARRRREGDVEAADPAEAADDVPAPTLTPSNAVPVLVSSDFLRMDALADECLAFISDRLEDVARGPLDVAALDTRLLRRLARVTPAARLESLRSEGGNRTASPYRRRERGPLAARLGARGGSVRAQDGARVFRGALRGRFARCDRCDRLFVAPGGAARGLPTLAGTLRRRPPRGLQ